LVYIQQWIFLNITGRRYIVDIVAKDSGSMISEACYWKAPRSRLVVAVKKYSKKAGFLR